MASFENGPGYAHVSGEAYPSQDWARIGLAVRLSMYAYMQSGANCEKGRKCLTDANFASELQHNVSDYVQWFYDAQFGGDPSPGATEIYREAARQCGLGNPAACAH